MTLDTTLKKQNIELSLLGLSYGEPSSDYFCTPVGAKVLYWTGVDGIHYCTIRGFDEMIFVVDPSAVPGEYVHPVAASLKDFLMLLLDCGSEAAIGQASRWERAAFDAFVFENQPDDAAKDVLARLQDATGLVPMADSYGYIRAIQASFDYRRLKFKPDYYEWAPEEPLVPTAPDWRVTFDGGFFGKGGRERPGQEVCIGKSFLWGDEIWHIPSVYVCGRGLVMDVCIEIDPARFRAFAEKWKLYEDDEGQHLTDAEREDAERENPLDIGFRAEVAINGKRLRQTHGYGMTWVAELPSGLANDKKAQWHLQHYGLDRTKCWVFRRLTFPWATKSKPKLKTIVLSLQADPVSRPAGQFQTPDVGACITLPHPVTGTAYTLTVENIMNDSIDHSSFRDQSMEYPTNYTRMDYRIAPEVSDLTLEIRDCGQGDHPRRRKDTPMYLPEAMNSVAVAIIGGADGPTAVFAGGLPGKLRAACSSLYFDVPETVTWRASFREIPREPITVELF